MVAGVVFWDHMTYDSHRLPPIEALSIVDMLGVGEIFVFLGHQTVYPICGQYSFGFIATLLDGKFPDLHTVDYKVSHAEVIRKITSNGYKLQVIKSRGTHGNTFSLTSFEQTCYMPLILNFPVNMDLVVTCNIQGPAINFAKATHQTFRPLHNLFYYLTLGPFLLQPGWHAVPCLPVLSLNFIKFSRNWFCCRVIKHVCSKFTKPNYTACITHLLTIFKI